MTTNTISQLAKLIADKKVLAILKVTKNKEGLTSKEISKKTNIPVNQLYYSIKKMLDQGLLEISQKKMFKNFQEFYYSSYKLVNHHSKAFAADNSEDDLSISAKWVAAHNKDVAQWILYQNQQFLEALQADAKKYGDDPQAETKVHTVSFGDSLQLSKESETKLMQDMLALIENAEKNDQGTDKKTINLLVEKWVQK